ncbi:hypothetical protein TDB9533_00446 [Thalassocella blandensis]|nr:hypothetical protein TDB9533_00446 [Thalassocella blandensis]
MNRHKMNSQDHEFFSHFNKNDISIKDFHHREHIRLAYVLLLQHDVDTACVKLKNLLCAYLNAKGVDLTKYHETLSRAWILAVKHFLENTPLSMSSADFIAQHPGILDASIMYTHYSRQRLDSDLARQQFVEPDLEPIPMYA